MSFFKRLFGGGKPAPQPGAEPVDINGYAVTPAPIAEGGQFRLAGEIAKDIGGVRKAHRFIRADVFADRDEAVAATLRKAQLIIDQNGDRMFGPDGS